MRSLTFFLKTQDTIMNLCIKDVKCTESFWNVCANNVTPYLERDVRDNFSSEEQNGESRFGLDSHADTSCAGKYVIIMEEIEGRLYDVYSFNEGHYTPMKKIQLINGMFSLFTSLGETIVVELNNALDFTNTMGHSLLCTNQARENGVKINDISTRYYQDLM